MIDAVFFVIHRPVFSINASLFGATFESMGRDFDILQGRAGLMNWIKCVITSSQALSKITPGNSELLNLRIVSTQKV